jgi:hypothetical protein
VLTCSVAEHVFPCRVNLAGPQDPRDGLREGPQRRHVHGSLVVDDVLGLPLARAEGQDRRT